MKIRFIPENRRAKKDDRKHRPGVNPAWPPRPAHGLRNLRPAPGVPGVQPLSSTETQKNRQTHFEHNQSDSTYSNRMHSGAPRADLTQIRTTSAEKATPPSWKAGGWPVNGERLAHTRTLPHQNHRGVSHGAQRAAHSTRGRGDRAGGPGGQGTCFSVQPMS